MPGPAWPLGEPGLTVPSEPSWFSATPCARFHKPSPRKRPLASLRRWKDSAESSGSVGCSAPGHPRHTADTSRSVISRVNRLTKAESVRKSLSTAAAGRRAIRAAPRSGALGRRRSRPSGGPAPRKPPPRPRSRRPERARASRDQLEGVRARTAPRRLRLPDLGHGFVEPTSAEPGVDRRGRQRLPPACRADRRRTRPARGGRASLRRSRGKTVRYRCWLTSAIPRLTAQQRGGRHHRQREGLGAVGSTGGCSTGMVAADLRCWGSRELQISDSGV